uniref:Uncharacterized protein n=1 Tax=Picea glauca TaxID=3330 RepID=A0A124GNG8_PICGL|nr:hypothetical protein ABT39_MTgene4122 [Picea glauca]
MISFFRVTPSKLSLASLQMLTASTLSYFPKPLASHLPAASYQCIIYAHNHFLNLAQ